MTDDLTSGQQFQAEIQDLLAVTRGMSDGEFSRLVKIRARGAAGELAARINQTPQDLQQPDPAVRGSSQEIPMGFQDLTTRGKPPHPPGRARMGRAETSAEPAGSSG